MTTRTHLLSAIGLLLLAWGTFSMYAQTRAARPTSIEPSQVHGAIAPAPAPELVPVPTWQTDTFVVQDGSTIQNFHTSAPPIGAVLVYRNGLRQTVKTDFVPGYSSGYLISFAPAELASGDTITLDYQTAAVQWIALPLRPPGTN